jgi:hypothetical protein
MPFWTAPCLLLPLDARGKGKKRLSPLPFSSPSLSLKPQKDTNTTSPLAYHVVEEWRGCTPWAVRGGCTKAALPCPLTGQRQAITPPFSAYKYKGREEARKEKNESAERKEKKEKKKKENVLKTESKTKRKGEAKKKEKKESRKEERKSRREGEDRKREQRREKKGGEKERKRKKKQRKKKEKHCRPPQSLHCDNSFAAASSTASTPPEVTSCCPVYFSLAQPLPAFANGEGDGYCACAQ